MANLFNFYQGTGFGTGQNAPRNSIDFFTGFYFPPSLEAGGTVGFLWQGMGIKLVEQTASFSGQVNDSNKNQVSFSSSFYGGVTPLVTESGKLYITFTGSSYSDNNERVTFSTSYFGSGIRDNIDILSYKCTFFSGSLSQDNRDLCLFNTPFTSGVISQGTNEISQLTLNMWGSFAAKNEPDENDISFLLSDLEYSLLPYNVSTASGSTGVALRFRLSEIFYDNA